MATLKGCEKIAINKVKKKPKSKSLKQRIRSIQRLLRKPDLPATVRISQERMLEFMQSKLNEQYRFEKDTKMIKKYKMVKFFEKRKLWRLHRAIVKEINDSPDQQRVEELEELKKKTLQDMNYVEYFPSDRKYISLFPAEPYTSQNVLAEQEELRRHVNEKVDVGELPQATFNKVTKSKNKVSKGRIHMDRRMQDRENKKKVLNSGIEEDDFFIDACGDEENTE